jgi:type IV pilus assembly protein PilW
MKKILRNQNGVTLIELLVALVISTILIAGIYRTFIGQQKTFTSQEQVVDVQQNARIAIGNMVREIRMAGFGNFSMPAIVNAGADTLTFRSAVNVGSTLTVAGGVSQDQIVVSPLTGFSVNGNISIGGVESNVISAINPATNTITLTNPLGFSHVAGTPVFTIRTITYQVIVVNGIPVLMRNDGGGNQPEADGIETLQFQYLDGDGIVTATPANIRIIRVSVKAKTNMQDPDYKLEVDGYRRREIASNIHLRNMGI